MEDIILYLCNLSDNQESFNKYHALHINIGSFQISISLNLEKSFINALPTINNINNLIDFTADTSVTKFRISISNNLEKSNINETLDEVNSERNFVERPISIANTILQLVKDLSTIHDNLVSSYNFISDNSNTDKLKYIGEISINVQVLELKTVEKIIHSIRTAKVVNLESIYCKSYYRYEKPKNITSVQFLNTNTKVRRLGYLKLFFRFIRDRKKIPEGFIDKRFEEYSLLFTSQLNDLVNNKGIIQDFRGKSAQPYITLLKEMDLITTINRAVVPTKWLKTYLTIRDFFTDNSLEVFVLDKIDKLFFLEVILKKDFLYTSIILEFLYVRPVSSSKQIIEQFQSLLISKIKKISNQINNKNNKSISLLKEIEKRVISWKKPEKYLEHIIIPRLNWLADLDLITLDNNLIKINDNCIELVSELNSWIDIENGYVLDSSEFIRSFYPHIYSKSCNGNYGAIPKKELINSLVDEYIDQSFSLFKTLAPNRVTSSQAFTFTKYCLYLKNNISISESALSTIIEENFPNKYIYKYQSSYGDGYIQKIQPQ
ncbi:hypothetical protein Emtol_2992 [Emticicia oligotrophica DSM 17448]|uniref:Uncharacterized protein n=1 Tax=Emticicia oligotrophica (strain DSM 17448 / CIP 109782 / MTCC 6937 / GPTSA100-15) TaxID=929562 RepID=A0ABN4ANV9_EMTOG|nr:hypothetical protein [Emticicia oligotrophica]AFK04125.1 hypothetical protein Emtol_2992 [Emticicia oligotrophica DSM 17448]